MTSLAEKYLKAMEFDEQGISRSTRARTQALTKAVGKCIEALTSIASEHKPSTETEEHWLKKSHEDCAMVLATDTKIARNALNKLEAAIGVSE